MAFKAWQGPFKLYWGPKKASQVLTAGAVVDQTSGYITVADISVASHLGVVQKTITAADSDYASATRIPVKVATSMASKWKASVLSTDTLAVTHVGTYGDLANAVVGLDITIASSADDAVYISDFFSTSEAGVILNSSKFMQPGIGSA